MKDIYLVLGFCLAVGLQILRIIEGQRLAPQRTEVEGPLFEEPETRLEAASLSVIIVEEVRRPNRSSLVTAQE